MIAVDEILVLVVKYLRNLLFTHKSLNDRHLFTSYHAGPVAVGDSDRRDGIDADWLIERNL